MPTNAHRSSIKLVLKLLRRTSSEKQKVLINEQRVNDLNLLYELTRDITLHN